MEPADMSTKHSDANTVMSGRVHGNNNPAANERMPKSVWQPGMVQRLADYIKRLREVDQQSNKPNVASQSAQPHVCERNPYRSCNCPGGTCADDDSTYRYARGPYAATIRCPISGQPCSVTSCRDWCESGVDRTKT